MTDLVEGLRRSANAATLARQHRAGFYELPDLVVSGFAYQLREAADKLKAMQAALLKAREFVPADAIKAHRIIDTALNLNRERG